MEHAYILSIALRTLIPFLRNILKVILLINNNPEEIVVLLLSCFRMMIIIPLTLFLVLFSLVSIALHFSCAFFLSFNCRTAHVGCALNLMKWLNSPN